MKLLEFKKDADYFSGKVSELNRQLSLAGIAIVWIFKGSVEEGIYVPPELMLPLLLFGLSLLVDMLHYVVGSIVWTRFHRKMEKEGFGANDEVVAPPHLNYPSWIFWGFKLFFNSLGFILLIGYLFTKIQ